MFRVSRPVRAVEAGHGALSGREGPGFRWAQNDRHTDMDKWQEELIRHHADESTNMRTVFGTIEKAAHALAFDHVAYCYQASLPASKPRITLIDNYPQAWRNRYLEAGYLEQDPRIQCGARSQRPIIWTDELFSDVPALWRDSRQHGLCHGWS